ncbi:peptidoglycan glycosyltransferase [Nibricoccus aquaticus]|uniref:Beta-lactamase n=1 Tax=Nibricoccus aquaticus TaxID=2576891 RepID=A0A290QL37_9BACT|nr:penicillin-binding transpeptidase domain-containing protein [Nibricoccus aquaticus]ATC65111.1 peptidoglycan glycosyltransferase [Nibricoccus aquaticus]
MADRTSDRSSSLMESHKGYDLRILFFYPAIAALLLILIGGLAYQQLIKTDEYHSREKQQNQRRILTPGPRGNIYDREGRLLVKNRARFYAAVNLDELRTEFNNAVRTIRKNYLANDDKDLPSYSQLRSIARYSVLQKHADDINRITGRSIKIDADNLKRHFETQLLLPYIIADELTPEEYARLSEQLPVTDPVQILAASTREYPYKNVAAHALGYVRPYDELNADLPEDGVWTVKMRGTIGKDGIEGRFNNILQGKPGVATYRVDPTGYRVDAPLDRRLPVQGQSIKTSLDIDLQIAAEEAIKTLDGEPEETGETDANGQKIMKAKPQAGAAVAIDVRTGEVLAVVSAPTYDLNNFMPRLSSDDFEAMSDTGAWLNRALNGLYQPGSTFKVLTSIAGLRAGVIDPATTHVECNGTYQIGNRTFVCHNHRSTPGEMTLATSLEKSCNIFFYDCGRKMGPDAIAAEARRFHLDQNTGIELPGETRRMVVPDPAWLQRVRGERWPEGETANYAIGQSALILTPLQMACFVASVARGETVTHPTLLHDPKRPRQKTEPIGLTPRQYNGLIEGMRRCVETGSGRKLSNPKLFNLQYAKIAGKTGTAQKDYYENGVRARINYAWFIGFAPYDNPEIAVAVILEGGPGDEIGGGDLAAPIAGAMLQKYFDKKAEQPALPAATVKTAAR